MFFQEVVNRGLNTTSSFVDRVIADLAGSKAEEKIGVVRTLKEFPDITRGPVGASG